MPVKKVCGGLGSCQAKGSYGTVENAVKHPRMKGFGIFHRQKAWQNYFGIDP